MKRAARDSARPVRSSGRKPTAPASTTPPRIPDTFTLQFHRTPEGWRVDGDAEGTGGYAMEAFSDAFCKLPPPAARPPEQRSTAPVLALTHFIRSVPPTPGCPACTVLERSCKEHAFHAALVELNRLRKRVARKGGAR